MNFALPEDVLEFKEACRDFAAQHVRPTAEERDREERWDRELWLKMGAMGLLGLPFPEEYGGQGAGCLATTVATEGFGEGAFDGGLALAWGAHTIIGSLPIAIVGREDQKQKYLPKLASGEWVAGLGLTEPGAGSDAAGSMATRAVKRGDRWILNGSKMYITNGPIGDVFLVMAVTHPGRGAMGISAFLVEKDFPGFRTGQPLQKLGMRTSTTSELIFEDCEVPEENLLGPENSGFMRIGRATLEWERTVLVAAGLGAMSGMLEEAIRYAKERKQFGEPIARFHAIMDKVARCRMKLDASRLLLYESAVKKDNGENAPIQSSMAKLHTTETCMEFAEELGQIFGGACFMKEYPIERFYRDARLATIGAGTSEVMRSIIAANLQAV